MNRPKGIILLGPTASGKTDLAIQIAEMLRTEIVSFDSRQFYQEMKVGTAVPTEDELSRVPHHFIQHLSVEEDYNAGRFAEEADALLHQLFLKHQHVVLVGGSGLYIQALLYGMDMPASLPEVRQEIEHQLNEKGLPYLQDELKKLDPEAYELIDVQNPVRVTRALEVMRSTGKKWSASRKKNRELRNDLPFEPLIFSPYWEREQLYDRINQRVELMMDNGLFEEAKLLYPKRGLKNLQTVGYQELFDHLDGKLSREEAVELIKRNTRRYAKRQLTWLRKQEEVIHLLPPFMHSFEEVWKQIN